MKYIILALSFLLVASISIAQDTNYVDPNYKAEKQKAPKKKSSVADRTYFGGTFGLSFGSQSGSILLEPMVGFKMTEKLSTGVGIGYRYGWGQYINGGSFSYNNYLGRIFSRYIIVPKIYAHVEYMVESYDKIFEFDSQITPNKNRTLVPFLFVGGGYRSQAGRGSFILQVLFNVLQNNPNSAEVYPSGFPYITVGYIGGF